MNKSSKDLELLRLNDLNNKVKNLDRKVSILISVMEYTNMKINEMHDDLFNNSPNSFHRSISPIKSPNIYTRNQRKSDPIIYDRTLTDDCLPMYPNSQSVAQKADDTYLGSRVPTYKTTRKKTTVFPEIKKSKNTNTLVSRRSFDSMSSFNS
jgi:hypothetical protein